MTTRTNVITAAFLLLFTTTAVLAQAQMRAGGEGRLPTVGEQLERHRIPITRAGLTEALRNPDAEVRSLAAWKLAEDGERGSIAALAEALASETDPTAEVNIAFALAQLGDRRGLSSLKTTCQSAGYPMLARITAVQYLIDLRNETCLEFVLQLLQSEDQQRRVQALTLVARFRRIPKEDLPRVLEAIKENSLGATPAVRSYASRALVSVGDSSVAPYLENAIAREHDQLVKSGMEKDLRKLQQQQLEP